MLASSPAREGIPRVRRGLRPIVSLGLVAALLAPVAGLAREDRSAYELRDARTQVIERAQLPAQARATEELIRSGGPFPYDKDGIVFGNRERLLPRHARGYYREYTVRTPGARDRGARRIVCGGVPPTEPRSCYYTDDHYASFRRIVP